MRGLLQARRSPVDDGHLNGVVEAAAAGRARTFAGFVALTALNPATVLHFTGLSLALMDRVGSMGTRLTFLAGIGVGSFVWQAALAWFGVHLGRRRRPSLQRRTRQIGSLVLLALAVALTANAT